MSIASSLRTFLLSKSAITAIIGEKAHHNRAPSASDVPFIVFFRRSAENEDELNAPVGQAAFRESFDVECVSGDLSQAEALAKAVRDSLNNFSGTLGAGTTQGVFVTDQDDEYQLRLNYEDFALHTSALFLEIVGYTEA